MPRGVPASGKRRPRAVSPESAPTVHVAAEDVAYRADTPATPPTVAVAAAGFDELTPEQAEIKRLRDLLAVERGRKDVEPEYEPEATADGDVIRIHFLEDGVTALGKLYYRGDELEFVAGSVAHRDTFDRLGRSWLDMRGDDFAQIERFGKVMFRNGPWPGKTYADATYENLRVVGGDASVSPPTQAEIEAAEKARKRRAAPRLPTLEAHAANQG